MWEAAAIAAGFSIGYVICTLVHDTRTKEIEQALARLEAKEALVNETLENARRMSEFYDVMIHEMKVLTEKVEAEISHRIKPFSGKLDD